MGRWANKYVIGLTGNIAVGKSVVRQMLQHLGAYTIDADGLSHQAMAPGAPAYKPVIESFGQFILNPDKTINRGALGNMVFSNAEALKKLEAITHPIIGQAINTLVNRSTKKVVVIEAIKLLEGDLANAVDAIWVVDAQPRTQYLRLVGKRKMTENDAKIRILAQNKQEDKVKSAQVVIKNDGNVEETWKQVQNAWNEQVVPGVKAMAQPTAPSGNSASAATPTQAADATDDVTASETVSVDTDGITIKRGMPTNAEQIANFINEFTGKGVNRMDVIMSFGQKGYLVAEDSGAKMVGLVGWQVENLITRVDEMYMSDGPAKDAAIYAMVQAIEEHSKELQSEVSFIFLAPSTDDKTLQPFLKSGYELTSVKDIKIPAWREAVNEVAEDGMKILTKRLRKDRVLKPI